jgi:Tfp pilus assembly protein PilE
LIKLHGKSHSRSGMTMAEVCIAVMVSAIFGAAAFATNQRLLLAIKTQRETAAASMALQWRMEKFRATSFSCIAGAATCADPDPCAYADPLNYVRNYILLYPGANSTTQCGALRKATDGTGNVIADPFAALGSLREQITISVYPDDGSTQTVMYWDAAHPGGAYISQNTNFPTTNSTMLKVDVLETWSSADNRQRSRQLSTIVTLGNIGP